MSRRLPVLVTPQDIERFFVDDREVAVWKLRCKHRGCIGGDTRIMHGEHAELTLTREGRNWYIQRFGKRRAIPSKTPRIDASSGPGRDAS